VYIIDDFTLLVAMGLAEAVGFVWVFERWVAPSTLGPRDPKHAATRSLAMLFHERVHSFHRHVMTLDEHSNEYRAVFSGNEWSSLTKTLERLLALDREVQSHVAQENYPQAQEVLASLYASSRQSEAASAAARGGAEWEESVHSMLKHVIQNLEAATHETKNLDQIQRPRKRQPTLVTLADVKKALVEDGVVRREMLNKLES
jgi:hypothetical protein